MKELTGAIIGIFLIFCQLHCCIALDVAGLSSSVVDLGRLVNEMRKTLYLREQDFHLALVSIQTFNENFKSAMRMITNTLEDEPRIRKFKQDLMDLQHYSVVIERNLFKVARIKRDVDNRTRAPRNMVDVDLVALERNIIGIRKKLLNTNTITVLKDYLSGNPKKFEGVCQNGKSHLQLLDSLIGGYKAITAQYFSTVMLTLELQEYQDQNHAEAKQNLRDKTNSEYTKVVKTFKEIMSDTSKELWKCDPSVGYNDNIRYTNKTDPNFAELRIFTRYIVGEEAFAGQMQTCEKMKCTSITELRNCPDWEHHLCTKVRACPGELVGCQPFMYDRQLGGPPGLKNHHVKICENEDKNAHHRYLSVVETHKSDETFQCKKPAIAIVTTARVPIILGGKAPSVAMVLPSQACEQCNCICQEKEMYFVDLQSVDADSDKVVTGAKLVVENNILRLQIEQAKLLANGVIDKNTIDWKPLQPINKTRLQWIYYEFRKFALNPTIFPNDEVVTGLRFHAKQSDTKMVNLFVNSKKIDFRKGTFLDQNKKNDNNMNSVDRNPKNKYDLTERDVSTKSKSKNLPDSTSDQYVELTVTSSAKDGGQSVVPFIDTQNVTANGPLSGASLYIRGQPGFGGFLGIKLFTFDIEKYVAIIGGL